VEAICSVGGRILIAEETESSKPSYPVGIGGRALVAQESDATQKSSGSSVRACMNVRLSSPVGTIERGARECSSVDRGESGPCIDSAIRKGLLAVLHQGNWPVVKFCGVATAGQTPTQHHQFSSTLLDRSASSAV
jgi:hypothetical protein